MWKLANVTPIFKKGDKELNNNYKPISTLPGCGKILEKIIFNNLYTYLHMNIPSYLPSSEEVYTPHKRISPLVV